MRKWAKLMAAATLVVTAMVAIPAVPAADALTISAACGLGQTTTIDSVKRTCTFADEFNAASLDRTKWLPQTNFITGTPAYHACYLDDPRVIQESAGALHLSIAKVADLHACSKDYSATNIIGGMVSTYHLFSQQYGRFEIRARLQSAPNSGTQQTLWLWPDDRATTINWPTTGEMDFAEFYSNYPASVVPFLHYTSNDNGGSVKGLNTNVCDAPQGAWHTYDVVWNSSTVEYYADGQLCLRNSTGDVAFNRKYIILLTQAMGFGTNAMTSDSVLPITMDIDYVRVWS